MRKIITIAWRNLWRNKRRTLITASSIFFALFYAILMRSFSLGTYNQMLDNSVTQFTGHMQIQDKEYMDNPVIDYSFPYNDKIINILDSNSNVENYFPTIRTGALASSGPDSKVAMITGIDIEKETKFKGLNKLVAKFFIDSNFVNEYIVNIDKNSSEALLKYKNRYYNSKENLREDLFADGFDTVKYFNQLCEKTVLPKVDLLNLDGNVMIGYKLADYLDLNIGDSIILFGQGFRGNTAIGKYKISALLNFPIDQFNRLSIYMSLKTSQLFLSAYDTESDIDTLFYVNYVSINTKNQVSMREQEYERILNTKDEIEKKLDNPYLTVVGWRNLNQQLVETIQIGNAKGFIFIFIFYLIIGFGILGTVMMLVSERKREFGMMMALGMKRRLLSLIVALEMVFITLIASVACFVVTGPLVTLGHNNPIKIHGDMSVQLQSMNMEPVVIFQGIGQYMFNQMYTVLIIVAFILLYAVLKINKLRVISSLRA